MLIYVHLFERKASSAPHKLQVLLSLRSAETLEHSPEQLYCFVVIVALLVARHALELLNVNFGFADHLALELSPGEEAED